MVSFRFQDRVGPSIFLQQICRTQAGQTGADDHHVRGLAGISLMRCKQTINTGNCPSSGSQIRAEKLAMVLHPTVTGDVSDEGGDWPMRAGVKEERARIESEARKLARSGDHNSWWSIRAALLAQGRFTQISYIFGNLWTCLELDRLCQKAQLQNKEGVS